MRQGKSGWERGSQSAISTKSRDLGGFPIGEGVVLWVAGCGSDPGKRNGQIQAFYARNLTIGWL